jgi:tetratricopeptide (TPR) repeat protein
VAGLGARFALAPPLPVIHLDASADEPVVQAVGEARQAVYRAPWSDAARGRLAMLLQAHGQSPETAALLYAQAEHLNPAEPRWPYFHAAAVKDTPAELELLRRSVELADRRSEAPDTPLITLADACLTHNHLTEAEAAYGRLLRRRQDHPRAHLGMARLELRRGRPNVALMHLRYCLDPTTRRVALFTAAEAHRQLKEPDEATAAARAAEAAPSDRPWPNPWAQEVQQLTVGRLHRFFVAQELQARGQLIESAELSSQEVSGHADVRLMAVGLQHLSDGHPDQAEAVFRRAVASGPASVDARFGLGRSLLAQEKYEEAAECFRRVLEMSPAHAGAYRELARCAVARGDQAEATRLLRRSLQYQPSCADAHRQLGELLSTAGQREEAVQQFSEALHLAPEDSRARQLLEQVRGREKPRP